LIRQFRPRLATLLLEAILPRLVSRLPYSNPHPGATVTAIFKFATDRRGVLFGLSLAVAFAFAATSAAPAFAQAAVPVEQLMAPGPLPDIVQGSASAPVTIVEYGALTCSHCQAFHAETWPTLKSKYVDTGKVKFILREFPLNPLDAAAFMLTRCAGPDKRSALVDLLYDHQKDWAFVDKPLEALGNMVKQAGISPTDFETCLKDQQLYEKVTQTRDEGAKNFHVDSTPTFFINGKRVNGALPIADFDKIIQPLLK
jgi:protein-disulfide isomerase